MAEEKILLTPEGVAKLQEELEYLKSDGREQVEAHLKEARAHGDLSENAEYDAAKEEAAELEARLNKIENMLANAQIIDTSEPAGDKVTVGVKVRVLNMKSNDEREYVIVGATEADPFEGRISNESPVGAGILGKSLGEIVDIEVPDGIVQFKILSIG